MSKYVKVFLDVSIRLVLTVQLLILPNGFIPNSFAERIETRLGNERLLSVSPSSVSVPKSAPQPARSAVTSDDFLSRPQPLASVPKAASPTITVRPGTIRGLIPPAPPTAVPRLMNTSPVIQMTQAVMRSPGIGNENITLTVYESGRSRVRVGLKEFDAVYDARSRTLRGDYLTESWIITLDESLTRIQETKISVGTTSSYTSYFRADGTLERYVEDHPGATFPKNQTYEFIQIRGKTLIREHSEHSYTFTYIGGPVNHDTRTFYEYDDQGRTLRSVTASRMANRDGVQNGLSGLEWEYHPNEVKRISVGTTSTDENFYADLNGAGADVFSRLNQKAVYQLIYFYPNETSIAALPVQRILMGKNDQGIFVPRVIAAAPGSDELMRIVVGELDAPGSSGDDLAFRQNQSAEGYQVSFGVHRQSNGTAEIGMMFKKDSGTVYVNFPKEQTIALDGIRYQIMIEQEGEARGEIRLQRVMSDGSIQIMKEGRLARHILNDAKGTVLDFSYDSEGVMTRIHKTFTRPGSNDPLNVTFNLQTQLATTVYTDRTQVYRFEITRENPLAARNLAAASAMSPSRVRLADWLSTDLSARNVIYGVQQSPLLPPPSAEDGGVDVNILDWNELNRNEAGVTSYRIYRRVLGEADWVMIRDGHTYTRFIDHNIDADKAYEYQISPLTERGEGIPIESWQITRSANYDRAYRGVQPENVLVLISREAPGWVDIAAPVTDADKANGRLDPISEEALYRYVGIQKSDLQDLDGDGVYHDLPHQIRVDTRGGKRLVEIPLGLYYAIRRGIPAENILYLDGVPAGERQEMSEAEFNSKVIKPISDHLRRNGTLYKINTIASVYHFPVVRGGRAWDDSLAFRLSESLFHTLRVRFDAGVGFSRDLGGTGFLATRIDGADEMTAKRMIDDAIWAEENYEFQPGTFSPGLRAFVDWKGPYPQGDSYFHDVEKFIKQSGLFGNQGEGWDSAANIDAAFIAAHPEYDLDRDGRLDDTFLRLGWYEHLQYQDLYNFARGAVAMNLDSHSAYSFRSNELDLGSTDANGVFQSSIVRPWASNFINRGAAATFGAVNEPYLTMHTMPQHFTHYLLEGYSFAEAGYYASKTDWGQYAWMFAFNGDPLYRPFARPRVQPIVEDGQILGYRHELSASSAETQNANGWQQEYVHVGGQKIFKDYDLAGRLFREQTAAGNLIHYLPDGKAVVYSIDSHGNQASGEYTWHREKKITTLDAAFAPLTIYGIDGTILHRGLIPSGSSDWEKDELVILEDGRIEIHRTHKNRPELQVFTQEGLLRGAEQDEVVVLQGGYEEDVWQERYVSVGTVNYSTLQIGDSARRVIEKITRNDGSVLVFSYENSRDRFSSARFYSSEGVILYTVTSTEPGVYRVSDEGSGWVLDHVSSVNEIMLFSILNRMPDYVKMVETLRSRVIAYVVARYGISREEAERQVLKVRKESVQWVFDLAPSLNQFMTIQRRLASGLTETFKMNVAFHSFSERFAMTPEGSKIVFDAQNRVTSETFQGGAVRNYFYDAEGVPAGYEIVHTGGRVEVFEHGSHRKIGETVEGQVVIRVGSGAGQTTLEKAVAINQKNYTIRVAAGTYQISKRILFAHNMRIEGEPGVVFEGVPGSTGFATIRANVSFNNITFRKFELLGEHKINWSGAVFRIESGKLHLAHAVVEDNSGDFGGAIYGEGAAVEIEDSVFRNNRSAGGGALRLVSSQVTLKRTLFENNRSGYYGAGAVDLTDSKGLLVEDCVFFGNTDRVDPVNPFSRLARPGALVVRSGQPSVVRRTVFRQNNGIRGNGSPLPGDAMTLEDIREE